MRPDFDDKIKFLPLIKSRNLLKGDNFELIDINLFQNFSHKILLSNKSCIAK